MKSFNANSFHKPLRLACCAAALSVASQCISAENFAEVAYLGEVVKWDLFLPGDAHAVDVRVVYTPPDVKGDSYLDQATVKGKQIAYPFSGGLQDGTYTWELRLVKEGPVRKGFSVGTKAGEGQIDENGRQVALVGKFPTIEGRTRLSNTGRDSIKTGSFTVVRGVIPEFELPEK